jgi:hypothetical protein
MDPGCYRGQQAWKAGHDGIRTSFGKGGWLGKGSRTRKRA